jgi:glutamine cyclotransferase
MKTWNREELFFTQGFTLLNDKTIIETSGLHQHSFLHHLKLNDDDWTATVDRTKKKTALERRYFGEGNDLMQGSSPQEQVIYWLTWRSRDILKYDVDFNR